MATEAAGTSDAGVLDLLSKLGPLGVLRLAELTHVTATAVRQRLSRLLAQGLIERVPQRAGRGRPSHRYSITEKGRRQSGANFGDLALALWHEIREIKDADVRRGLLSRVSSKMAAMYAGQVRGSSVADRMESVSELFAERKVPVSVDRGNALPVLTVHACPYPQLAEQDRGICTLEKMMFSELVGSNVRLTDCRLDGASCCKFETN